MSNSISMPKRVIAALAMLFSFRMLGLFIILPVFSIHAGEYKNASPSLIGLALGIYGLTQAIFQLPLGIISDRIGRKPIIIGGLVIFIIGSIICAIAINIHEIIIGRALQGAGAIGSTVLALLADLTTIQQRTKAMAIVGIAIGISFMIAMIIGPFLVISIGLAGLFWLTAILGGLGIIIILLAIPKTITTRLHRDVEPVPKLLIATISNLQLLRLDFSILCLHALLTASFIAVPIVLLRDAHLATQHQWLFYLPILILAFIATLPIIIVAEKYRQIKAILIIAIIAIGLSQLLLLQFHRNILIIAILLFIFFTAFTLLEAILPSLVSKIAPADGKGTAIGIFSSAQFLGIFLGGIFGGWIFTQFNINAIFIFCAAVSLVWLLIAISLQKPPYHHSH